MGRSTRLGERMGLGNDQQKANEKKQKKSKNQRRGERDWGQSSACRLETTLKYRREGGRERRGASKKSEKHFSALFRAGEKRSQSRGRLSDWKEKREDK